MNDDEPTCVATYSNEIEAEMAKMKLGMEGIGAFIAKDDCGGMRPYLQTTTGVRLMVKAKDLEATKRLLTPMNEEENGLLVHEGEMAGDLESLVERIRDERDADVLGLR